MDSASQLFETDSFEALEAFLSSQMFAMKLEPWGTAGSYSVLARHFSADGIDILDEQVGGGKTVRMLDPTAGAVLTLPVTGTGEINLRGGGIVDGAMASVIDTRMLAFSHFGDGRNHRFVALGEDKLLARLARHLDKPIQHAPKFNHHIALDAGVVISIQLMSSALLTAPLGDLVQHNVSLRDSLGNTFVDMLLEHWPNSYSERLRGRQHNIAPRHVRRAIDLIASDEPGLRTVEQLAERLDVSPRTLQYGFERFLETPVQKYWRNHRLERARDELLARPDLSVRHIAMTWGFTHVGRFNAYFVDAFGMTPGQLRRESAPSRAKPRP